MSSSSNDDLERYGVWLHPQENSEARNKEESVLTIDDLKDEASSAGQYGILEKDPPSTSGDFFLQEKVERLSSELENLKQDISELRGSVQSLRTQSTNDAPSPVVPKQGFFDQEEKQEQTIALTGSELGNILRTSDIVEEEAADEAAPEDQAALLTMQEESPSTADSPSETDTASLEAFGDDFPNTSLETTDLDSLMSESSDATQTEAETAADTGASTGFFDEVDVDQPIAFEEIPDLNVETQEIPLETQEIPLETQEIPLETQEFGEEIDLSHYDDISSSGDPTPPQESEALDVSEDISIPSPSDLDINTAELGELATPSTESSSLPDEQTGKPVDPDIRTLVTLAEKLVNLLSPPEREHIITSTEWDVIRRLSGRVDSSSNET